MRCRQEFQSEGIDNLVAQFNDIGQMIAAGQNPLVLAIQQGTQITQTLGNAGAAGAVRMLGAAFVQALNPLNLITLGVIAFGAAAIQALFSASEEAMGFDDALADLNDRVEAYIAAADKAGATTAALRKEFGAGADAARQYYRDLAEIEAREALRAGKATVEALQTSLGIFDNIDGPGNQVRLAEVFGLSVRERDSRKSINAVIAELEAVRSAPGIEESVAALERLKAAMEAAAPSDGVFSSTEDAALRSVNQLLLEQAALRERIAQSNGQEPEGQLVDLAALVKLQAEVAAARAEDAARAQELLAGLNTEVELRVLIAQHGRDSAIVAAARAEAEREVFAAMVESLDVSAAMKDELLQAYDAANAVAGAQIAAMIEAALGPAASLAARLWDAAAAAGAAQRAQSQLEQMKIEFSPGGQNLMKYGGRGAPTAEQVALDRRFNADGTVRTTGSGSRGGAGGGGGGAKAEANAMAELISRQERELELLREADPVKKEMLRYRQQLTGATEAERQKLEELIATRIREEEHIKAVAAVSQFAGQAAYDFLDQLIVQGKSASEVMRNLASTILQAAMQALILGQGPLAGIFGVSGSIFDLLAPKGVQAGLGASKGISATSKASSRSLLEQATASGPGFAQGGYVGAPGREAMRTDAGTRSRPTDMHVHIHGAMGDAQIRAMVAEGVGEGLRYYDANVLPRSVAQISSDPRVVRR